MFVDYIKIMPMLCCLGYKKNNTKVCTSPRTAFRERLPEHIKNLTVDVSYTNTEVQPKCVPSPKERRSINYDSDSD